MILTLNEMRLKLIKISFCLTLLRFFPLILTFLPLFLFKGIGQTKFIGFWILFWIIAFIFQLLFIRRYKVIGKIELYSNYIEIDIHGEKIIFHLRENIKIFIE